LGIGDWGLGIGDWGLGPIPNPQSPIPIFDNYIIDILFFFFIYKEIIYIDKCSFLMESIKDIY
jgi:hypothetical protein